MKGITYSFIFLSVLSSCGKKKTSDISTEQSQVAQTNNNIPQESVSPLVQKDTLSLDNTIYYISLNRNKDTSLDKVKDENDVLFYDNKVVLTISTKERELLTHVFSKEEFKKYIREKDYAIDVFQGMALDRDKNSNQKFVFAAQIGQPGLEGEGGYAFSIEITKDGNITIIPVNGQPTTKEDLLND